MAPRIVLLHGIATTASVWDRVIAALADQGIHDVVALERPCTGSLTAEMEALAPYADGALVVGQSGGATLALALAASDRITLAGALAHEPAVGSLLPGLLAPVAAAYAEGGIEGLGATLYGPSWSIAMVGPDHTRIPNELSMFRAFEPAAAPDHQGSILVTVGEKSPRIRHEAAAALHDGLGYEVAILHRAAHFAAWDAPEAFATAIARQRRSSA